MIFQYHLKHMVQMLQAVRGVSFELKKRKPWRLLASLVREKVSQPIRLCV